MKFQQPVELLSERRPSVALFNDTGKTSHVGCKGVTSGHDRMLARLGIRLGYRSYLGEWRELWKGDREASLRAFWDSDLPGLLEGIDAVVVNGEGTIHHGCGLHLLTILAGAQKMGLATFLVNAVFQECEQDLETLRNLDDFTVRDAQSSAYLERLGISHRIVFDSILEASFAPNPVHDFTGKIVVTDWICTREGDVGTALKRLLSDLGSEGAFYPLESPERENNWQHAVADLRTARLVATGRHHGVYLAGLAGVPFVAFGSNTWKVEGLLSTLPGNLRTCAAESDLRPMCEEALRHCAIFERVQESLLAQVPLTTFQNLAEIVPVSAKQSWSAGVMG